VQEQAVVALLWEVREECDRVVTEEGYNQAHDDEHTDGSLAAAAAAYALEGVWPRAAQLWPWDATRTYLAACGKDDDVSRSIVDEYRLTARTVLAGLE
jgi:hypothetical protein